MMVMLKDAYVVSGDLTIKCWMDECGDEMMWTLRWRLGRPASERLCWD